MAERAFEPYSQMWPLHTRYNAACSVRFSPDGNLLAAACNHTIHTYAVTPRKTHNSLRDLTIFRGDNVTDICFSPDSRFLATSSLDSTIRIWDVCMGFLARTLTGHRNSVSCVRYNPNSITIASGSFDDTIRIWNGRSGACIKVLPARLDGIITLDVSPDGSMIVAGGLNGACGIWDMATGNMMIKIKVQFMPSVGSVQFSSDGKFVLMGLLNSSLRIWSMDHGNILPTTLVGHVNTDIRILSTFIRADERYVMSGSEDNCLYAWEVTSGRLVQRIDQAHAAPVQSVTSHPTRNMIASASLRDIDIVKIWTPNPLRAANN